MNIIRCHFKWLGLAVVIVAVWLFFVLDNKFMSDKINGYLLTSKPFAVADYFTDAQVVCAIAPYMNQTQNIAPVREALSARQVMRLNRRVSLLFGEEGYWHLLLIRQGDYELYRIEMRVRPNFAHYQCVSKHDEQVIYPIYDEGQWYFELR